MKEGDAVRVTAPGDPSYGLIGHIVSVEGNTDYYWVFMKETDTTWKYRGTELVVVQPEL